jgi:hypothetical protein
MGTTPLTLVQAASLQSATSIDNEHVGRHSGGPAAAIELNTKPIRWGRGGRAAPIFSAELSLRVRAGSVPKSLAFNWGGGGGNDLVCHKPW